MGRLAPTLAAIWLAAASFVFYANWNPLFVFLLAASITVNYIFSVFIRRCARHPATQSAILIAAVTINLLVLGYFKYLFPLLAWLNSLGLHISHSGDSVILPLGISFFTFTQLAYLIDCRAGSIKDGGFLNYVLFVSFFPHLIAGPILHHREIMPQFARPDVYRLNPDDLRTGLALFVIGLAKKRFIADNMASVVEAVFSHPAGVGLPMTWIAVLGYSLQIYFDFSGYSDMAIGLARMFGIKFPMNFNSPYKATSIIDFWQRWHMTLTRFLTAYLYNPAVLWFTRWRMSRNLPVSRQAIASPSGFASIVALPMLYTMFLAGVWHGAGPQYIVFGLLHGGYLIINHAWRTFVPHRTRVRRLTPWAATPGKVILTFSAILVAQVFFRAGSCQDALQILCSMVGLRGLEINRALLYALPIHSIAIWAAAIAMCFFVTWGLPNSNQIIAKYEQAEWHPALYGVLHAALLFVAVVVASGPPVQFLYFQF